MSFQNRRLHLEKTRIPLNAMSSSQISKRMMSNVMRDKETKTKKDRLRERKKKKEENGTLYCIDFIRETCF